MKELRREKSRVNHLFYIRFFIGVLTSSFLICVVLFIKNIFKEHISVKCQYYSWFLILIVLAMPLIPSSLLNLELGFWWLPEKLAASLSNPLDLTAFQQQNSAFQGGEWMMDFALSVSRHTPNALNTTIILIWIVGMMFFTLLTICYNYKMYLLKRSLCILQNKKIEGLFQTCKRDMRIGRNIILCESDFIQTPMIFSFFQTYIVFPKHLSDDLTDNEMRYVLLHELSHYKNKDIFINYMLCFFQIIYWFNPLVWFAFNQMRTDREIACDITVLKRLHTNFYGDYGRTIINFADKSAKNSSLMVAADIIGSKHQIKKRIEKIVSYTVESRLLRVKSIAVFVILCIIMMTQVVVLSAVPYPNVPYVFKNKNVVYEDLSDYFNGFDGCFVLYNLKTDQYTIHNKSQSTMRVSPNSTYKIYSSLIGLETHVIQVENSKIKWDGINYPYESWNKDQHLASAMRDSVSWYFQHIDQKVGHKNLQEYFNKLSYGNGNLTGGVEEYWLESSLKISAIEQVQLLKSFYTYEIDFKEKNIDSVKDALKLSVKDGAVLSGKTGTGIVNGENKNGWFIGYVENKGEVYFFTAYIQDKAKAGGSAAAEMTLSVLKDKNIY